MAKWIPVAQVADLKPGEGRVVNAEGRELALFNVGGRFYAVDNVCPHQGGPIGEGMLDGPVVTCPWHGWRFDVCTGKSAVIPSASIATFECAVEGDRIQVKIE